MSMASPPIVFTALPIGRIPLVLREGCLPAQAYPALGPTQSFFMSVAIFFRLTAALDDLPCGRWTYGLAPIATRTTLKIG